MIGDLHYICLPYSSSRHIGGVWNSIREVETEIQDMGINLASLLHPNPEGSGWVWELESNKCFSVCSLRKLIDASLSRLRLMKRSGFTWSPIKQISSYGVCLIIGWLLRIISRKEGWWFPPTPAWYAYHLWRLVIMCWFPAQLQKLSVLCFYLGWTGGRQTRSR